MNKVAAVLSSTVFSIVFSTVLGFSSGAMAQGNGNGNQGSGNGNGGPAGSSGTQDQVQLQGQAQGQLQGQAQGQVANGGAGGQGGEGGDGGNGFGLGVGVGLGGASNVDVDSRNNNLNANLNANKSNSQSSSNSGSSSTANVGDTASKSASIAGAVSGGNKVTQEGANLDIDTKTDILVEGDDYTYKYSNDYPASQASSVFASICQTGMSGQADKIGINVVNSDIICDTLKVAVFYQEAARWEHANEVPTCVVVNEDEVEVCTRLKEAEYIEEYHKQMDYVGVLMDKTEEMGLIDRFFGFMVRPLMVIGALIWLL